MQNNIEKVVEAVTYIENEGLKLRDQVKAAKSTPELFKELSERKQEIYSAKESFLNLASKQNLLLTTGYVVQRVGKFKVKIYQNKVVGDSSEKLVTSFKPYKYDSSCEDMKLGEIGLMSYREMETDLDLEKALEIVKAYTGIKEITKSAKKTASKGNVSNSGKREEQDYPIKETKSIELDKLRVVKDVHTESTINRERYAAKKEEMKALIAENKGKYPKSEAIVARKRKDPEDRRRVIYEIEDGFRRFMISKELGLSNVQVSIIEE